VLDQATLEAGLPIGRLGQPLYFYRSIGSTNARAVELIADGAPHGTLVVSEGQTAGRGRGGRRWLTPFGQAIALSLILRWASSASVAPGSLTVFGALGVAEAAEGFGIDARIKWPNDVLVAGRKVAGVLVEAQWLGSRLASAVVGIGVNVRPGSVPPGAELDYPAGCLDDAAGTPVDANAFLLEIVRAAGRWVPKLGSDEMLEAWDTRLAFRGDMVSVDEGGARRQGRLASLDRDGNLLLETAEGMISSIGPTAADLRPIDSGLV
jgi:BirA family biotin operon repressor/biotin-[acetyl-CoA-carboxylase] ligase